MAYFDWNATAPLLQKAREVWLEASERSWANPSTAYRAGARARLALESAREQLAGMLACSPQQVLFTSGATEANNGFLREMSHLVDRKQDIWISAIEHPSVREPAQQHWGSGHVREIPVSRDGRIDLNWVSERVKGRRPALVSVMAANNETGVLQPVSELCELCRNAGVPFHCDAVQWFGKAASMDWSGCAAVTLSGHKFGAPRGVGCLVLGDEWKGLKIQSGGAQEMDSRAGTENVPGIVAMVAALEQRVREPVPEKGKQARAVFEAALLEAWPGEIQIHGAGEARLWNTCSLALPQFKASRWISRLDQLGFEVSSGSACSSGKEGPSPVLQAMGVDPEAVSRTIRISSGWETAPEEWDALLRALLSVREILSRSEDAGGPGRVIEI